MNPIPTNVDERKSKAVLNLVAGMHIGHIVTLLHSGDDFCWLQYYMCRFLQKKTLILIKESDKELIRLTELPKDMYLEYYKDDEEMFQKTSKYMDALSLKVFKEAFNKEFGNKNSIKKDDKMNE